MNAFDRLRRYAAVHTASSEDSRHTPSTDRQFDLARLLEQEMRDLGLADVGVDEHCYVYGTLPASPGLEQKPCVGFIAHLDTIPDFPGEHVQPRIVEQYDGGDLPLGDSGRLLSPRDFPHLRQLKGRTLMVTDGTTLLGADDKAGVAEIMTLAETILRDKIPHGPIALCFCPDEEIGHGAALLDLARFGASFAYTLDGGVEGELSFENFNACAASFEIRGFNVHPGSAKDTMINAALVATEINAMLPAGETPRDTQDYQGFFHLCDMCGDVEKASLHYIVRDHDAGSFDARKNTLRHIEELINAKYGPGTATLTLRDQYRNMAEVIREHYHTVELAQQAIRDAGMEPIVEPIRGGTDGAQLTYRGLPCPNLGTGGFAFHGPFEHVSREGMDKCVEIILHIVERVANET